MKSVLFVFGTRPEAIKMAPVIEALRREDGIAVYVCVTAQQRGMMDQVLDVFGIAPDYDLDLMISGQTLTGLTAKLVTEIEPVLRASSPHLVLVHGDTTTSMVSALAAFYQKIPVGHIEAGLRTGNLSAPWPEELNRQITARIASLHFAPTECAAQNLVAEGISRDDVQITGNTVVDALMKVAELVRPGGHHHESMQREFAFLRGDQRIILVTGHRRESFGLGFDNICRALRDLAMSPDIQIVYPVHLNPNVKQPVQSALGDQTNIHLIAPQSYLQFVYLMDICDLILTDSGGVQEEAPSLGKPVLVMRDNTERPEATAAGTAVLVGTSAETIVAEVLDVLNNSSRYISMSQVGNPYGDGKASERIVAALRSFLSE